MSKQVPIYDLKGQIVGYQNNVNVAGNAFHETNNQFTADNLGAQVEEFKEGGRFAKLLMGVGCVASIGGTLALLGALLMFMMSMQTSGAKASPNMIALGVGFGACIVGSTIFNMGRALGRSAVLDHHDRLH